ncbi:MAG: fused MFS/spermidine synthase [Acidobacteriota bacterium]
MPRFPLLLVLFFLSGSAALVYELVWFHLVQLVVGASSISVAVILTSFMGGMALGAALVPRWLADRWHPLQVLAVLEVGTAVIGAVMPAAIASARMVYVAFGVGEMSVLARAAVAAVILIPPTVLMGATLPVMSRWTGGGPWGTSRLGFLYMANAAGAASGTVLAGFVLLRLFDTVVASGVAVTLNLSVAAGAWFLARQTPARDSQAGTPVDTAATPSGRRESPAAWPALAVAGLSGLSALGAEVIWTRQLAMLFGASIYTFALILAVFLAGLGLGGAAGATLARRSARPMIALAAFQLLLAVAIGWGAWAIVSLLPAWQPSAVFLPEVAASPWRRFGWDAFRSAVAMLPAALLWGASFPLAIAAAGPASPVRAVARVNAVNTLGALVGAIGFTLVGMPVAGSHRSQEALVLVAAAAALVAARAAGRTRLALELSLVAGAAALGVLVVPPVPAALIAYGRAVSSWDSVTQVLYLAEGATASVAVTEGIGGARQFHIAGKVEASDMDVDMRLERMLGHIPALVHPNPRSVLIVGVGAGVTAGALSVHPGIERIVICEIEPVVPASAQAYFAEQNHHVFDDPRVEIVFDDARHFLQTTRDTFDIITSDPIHPWVRGAATLYSLEYLQLVRGRLNPGGVVSQWVPLYETDIASVKSEIGTFARVFPDTTLWNPDLLEEGYDLVALGRVGGGPISEAGLDARLRASHEVARSLAQVRLPSASALLSTYAGRASDLAPWLADAEINRERHLRLQYLAGLASGQDARFAIFQALVSYRRYPADLFDASAGTEARLRAWYAATAATPPSRPP